MNLMYEDLPETIVVNGREIGIITDFRECIRLLDLLKDTTLNPYEKKYFIDQYFLEPPGDFEQAMDAMASFLLMEEVNMQSHNEGEGGKQKDIYSFSVDYPFIFSAFLQDYKINLRTIPYLHWWEFHMLFEGLSESTEIKKRMMYRSADPSKTKDREERKRIERIQRAIRLPEEELTDYDIGDAFGW